MNILEAQNTLVSILNPTVLTWPAVINHEKKNMGRWAVRSCKLTLHAILHFWTSDICSSLCHLAHLLAQRLRGGQNNTADLQVKESGSVP